MKRHLASLIACLMISAPASAASAQQPTQYRWMGDLTCGGWRSAPRSYETLQKAALLNWVLGLLSGRADIHQHDVLANVEVSSVAAWIDDYCDRNPLDDLITASFQLEKALIARRQR